LRGPVESGQRGAPREVLGVDSRAGDPADRRRGAFRGALDVLDFLSAKSVTNLSARAGAIPVRVTGFDRRGEGYVATVYLAP
jgi:hypothetical protein